MAERNAVQKVLPVIATILVVLGVVAIARLNVKKQDATAWPPSAPGAAASATWTVLQSGGKLSLTNDQGDRRECELPDGFANVDRADKDGFTVRNATGARMLVSFECIVKDPKLVPGLANPSGLRAANVSGKRRDGAGVLEVSDGKITEEITLRGKNSRPYRDPEVVGWLDDNVFAVTAFQGDARYALTVQTTGRITELLKLPENAVEFKAGAESFWYVTVTPGEGIELGPRGPSELHRVSADATDTVVSKEEGSVIERVSLGPDGTAVFVAGGTLMRVNTDGKVVNAGPGIPLGGTDDGELIVNRNRSAWVVSKEGISRALTDGSVGADVSAAWIVRQTLDEPTSTK